MQEDPAKFKAYLDEHMKQEEAVEEKKEAEEKKAEEPVEGEEGAEGEEQVDEAPKEKKKRPATEK